METGSSSGGTEPLGIPVFFMFLDLMMAFGVNVHEPFEGKALK